jgi:predicted thioesterase
VWWIVLSRTPDDQRQIWTWEKLAAIEEHRRQRLEVHPAGQLTAPDVPSLSPETDSIGLRAVDGHPTAQATSWPRDAWGSVAIRAKVRVPAVRFDVTDADTAIALGSGDVPVLATPRLIAWMEAATVQSAMRFVGAGQTTVGTAVRIEHRRPTPVGGSVEVSAEASSAAGRHLTFTVKAVDSFQELVAVGEIERAILHRERFLEAALKPER